MSSGLTMPIAKESTTARGPMRKTGPTGPLILSGALALFATSAAPTSAEVDFVRTALERTNTGVDLHLPAMLAAAEADNDVQPTGSALMELRRLSGLTWDQLARLFDVDRRSLHFWASGKAMNAQNEERLRRTLGTVRSIYRGSARDTRDLLLGDVGGVTVVDLLRDGAYDDVVARYGSGAVPIRPELPPLSDAARAARAPRPPAELVDALQDSAHITKGVGKLIRATPIRRGRRE